MNLTVLYKKYRRLRYFAIVVIVSILGLIGFGSCFNLSDGQIEYLNNNSIGSGENVSQGGYILLYDNGSESSSIIHNYCVVFSGFSRSSDFSWKLNFNSVLQSSSNNPYYGLGDGYSLACISGWRRYFLLQTQQSSNVFNISKYRVITADKLFGMFYDTSSCPTCPTCPTCPECTNCSDTESLLQSCNSDLQTCNSNLNSCMNGGFSGSSWSALFINNIQHLGAPIINIDIPEEFEWNYNYGSGEEIETMNIDIEGYGYDQEKMQKMVNTQFAEMDNEDLSNVISKIADFIPLLLIAGIFIRIRHIIKKRIFKK